MDSQSGVSFWKYLIEKSEKITAILGDQVFLLTGWNQIVDLTATVWVIVIQPYPVWKLRVYAARCNQMDLKNICKPRDRARSLLGFYLF